MQGCILAEGTLLYYTADTHVGVGGPVCVGLEMGRGRGKIMCVCMCVCFSQL